MPICYGPIPSILRTNVAKEIPMHSCSQCRQYFLYCILHGSMLHRPNWKTKRRYVWTKMVPRMMEVVSGKAVERASPRASYLLRRARRLGLRAWWCEGESDWIHVRHPELHSAFWSQAAAAAIHRPLCLLSQGQAATVGRVTEVDMYLFFFFFARVRRVVTWTKSTPCVSATILSSQSFPHLLNGTVWIGARQKRIG